MCNKLSRQNSSRILHLKSTNSLDNRPNLNTFVGLLMPFCASFQGDFTLFQPSFSINIPVYLAILVRAIQLPFVVRFVCNFCRKGHLTIQLKMSNLSDKPCEVLELSSLIAVPYINIYTQQIIYHSYQDLNVTSEEHLENPTLMV